MSYYPDQLLLASETCEPDQLNSLKQATFFLSRYHIGFSYQNPSKESQLLRVNSPTSYLCVLQTTWENEIIPPAVPSCLFDLNKRQVSTMLYYGSSRQQEGAKTTGKQTEPSLKMSDTEVLCASPSPTSTNLLLESETQVLCLNNVGGVCLQNGCASK